MTVDFDKLREQTLESGLDEEAVTVNTRALIDKVLARYSGEWTTLREMIQNASDSGARKVTIRFETLPSPTVPLPANRDPSALLRHTLLHHTLQRLLISNDGAPFNEDDWQRLKRIAEGNPDETKIGAFGCGFYAVFESCENPFVTSGDQTIAFYWKTNSLFTRRGRLPAGSKSDTCFVLDYRSTTSPAPNLLSLCHFLSTSLTFVGLESIELWLDQFNILQLSKKTAPSSNVSIPSDIDPKTKDGLMRVASVDHQNAQIDARWMNAVAWTKKADSHFNSSQPSESGQGLRTFFSRLTAAATTSTATRMAEKEEESLQNKIVADLAGNSTATVFLRVNTVHIQTNVSKSLAAELQRATKKPPPKSTRIAILTSSHEESSASMSTMSGLASAKAPEIFASVLPKKDGRIFIGFPTSQTTGLLAHISAPSVIPTVERESIDLNARHIRDWNIEMIRVAGIACRIAYNEEMTGLKDKVARQLTAAKVAEPPPEHINSVLAAAIHVCNQFTFQDSTPSSRVGQLIEEAFWTCHRKMSIEVLSSRGILPSSDVRIASENLSFVSGIPVVPSEVIAQAAPFLEKLKSFGLVSDITTKDIKRELERQALTETQAVEFLKWAAMKIQSAELDRPALSSLFSGTVITIEEDYAKSYPSPVLLLGNIQYYPNPVRMPGEMPIPGATIPFRLVKTITKQLDAFGWTELQIVPWLRNLCEQDGKTLSEEQSLTGSAAFATQVHPILSRAWDSMGPSSKATVVELLRDRTAIPTKFGLRKPAQAYFASVRLFDDLPTVHGLQGVKEKYLAAIGVRKVVELSVVFARLMHAGTGDQKQAAEGKWDHKDLIRYLVSVRNDIPADDMKKLRETPICPAEADGGKTAQLFRLSELHFPKPEHRDLKLRTLYWPDRHGLQPGSEETHFLTSLGLLAYPSAQNLIQIMAKAAADDDSKMHHTAMQYFLSNHISNGYNKLAIGSTKIKFLPLLSGALSQAVAPKDCFTNAQCGVLGFAILRADLQRHAQLLGVEQDPPIAICIERLIRQPPLTHSDAKKLFGYFAGRLNEIGASGNLAHATGTSPIVPIASKDRNVRFVSPRSCFLGDSQTYGDIFDFVDFGQEANSFLLKVGSKHEPTTLELGDMLTREPARLFNTLGAEKYLSLLRRLADNIQGLKSDKKLWNALQKVPCLLAHREVSDANRPTEEAMDYDDDETVMRESLLSPAHKIILIDDFPSYQVFKAKLVTCPQDDMLESFYSALGSPWLRSLVEEDQRMGQLLRNQDMARQLHELILERSRLFLHEHTRDAIRHDAKWLEQALQVKAVSTLTMTRTLKGYDARHNEKRTACLHRESKHEATLYVTENADYYEVSRALMSLFLKRPKGQDYMALEVILETDLRRLKKKGYNVDRILRQKAAEFRVAEQERQRQLDEEQARLAKQEESRQKKIASHGQGEADAPKPIPGAFDLPIHEPSQPQQLLKNASDILPESVRKSGLFSNIKKHLGMDKNIQEQQEREKQRLLEGPQQGPTQPELPSSDNNKVSSETEKGKPPAQTDEPIQDHVDLQRDLLKAVKASRGHQTDTIYQPPKTNVVKEAVNYCDGIPEADLREIGTTANSMRIFVDTSMASESSSSFLNTHLKSLAAFSKMLASLADVFLLPSGSLHIYYNRTGPSIAFNTNGAIFCNLRFLLSLHWDNYVSNAGMFEAVMYWYVTLCHELAHNLVGEHSARHEFYTESFMCSYMPKLVAKFAYLMDIPGSHM